jgi:nucleoside-diphosphate-sugar epimerase
VTRSISRRTARTIGAVLEAAYTLLCMRTEPPLTRFVADELATSHWFDISAARRELGYEPRVSVEQGLIRLKEWFREQQSP